MSEDFHLNGHDPGGDVGAPVDETPEQLKMVKLKLNNLKRDDGQLVSMTPQQLGLLHKMLTCPDKAQDLTAILLICDFLNEDEANKELNAFYEAKRLGMDTQYNIDHALSRAAINRKGSHKSNRVAVILDSLSHTKFTSNSPQGRHDGNKSGSPLS